MKERLLMVGEAAKKLGVSVRTLQHYDNIGLISPSQQSDGGRRLYSDKDLVILHQILSLKYLGFSLDEIKEKLFNLDSPKEVIEVLETQENQIAEQIKTLKAVKKNLEALRNEVEEMNAINWSKYANIIELLREQNENYWIVKHFDDKTFLHAAGKYDSESSKLFVINLEKLWDKVIFLIDSGKSERCAEAQALAKEWWDMITEFTGGDMNLLQDLIKFSSQADKWKNKSWKEKWSKTQSYLAQALEHYFKNNEIEVKI